MKRAEKEALKMLLAAAAGGVAAALACRWLTRLGVQGNDAAIGVSLVGIVGAIVADGLPAHVSAGAAAFGTSQLALRWFAALDRRVAEGESANGGGERNGGALCAA